MCVCVACRFFLHSIDYFLWWAKDQQFALIISVHFCLFIPVNLGIYPHKLYLFNVLEYFLSVFASRFQLSLIFKFLIHFEVTFSKWWEIESRFYLPHEAILIFQHHLLRTPFFFLQFLVPWFKSNGLWVHGFNPKLCSVCLCLPLYKYKGVLDYHSFGPIPLLTISPLYIFNLFIGLALLVFVVSYVVYNWFFS